MSCYYRLPHALRWQLAPLWSPRAVLRRRRELRDPAGRFHPYAQRGAIFVHVPKCAGTSVARAIFGQDKFAHLGVREYQLMFSPAHFASVYKFTVVRNPWDRLVSAWHFLRSDHGSPGDRAWVARHLAPYGDFADFVAYGLARPEIRARHHFRPQVSYLRLPGQSTLLIDQICRAETLDRDLAQVCDALQLPQVSLPRINTSAHRDYRSCYDERTRAIVAQHYRDDIAAFGYTFDGIARI
ncbi:sulfotransferase family 2 domain-containing protein [Solimonas marina]|uniref:Sulfotransferase family protein n=1 Tax=Solimonas marina TaxID=2714601 RepID=A0A969W6S9_9GAMM|nr:sulfotransferase family 2 domain-containing protein [Solimonas marina]NKF21647.1 sulfotransferase family protein [Solimonas marina]